MAYAAEGVHGDQDLAGPLLVRRDLPTNSREFVDAGRLPIDATKPEHRERFFAVLLFYIENLGRAAGEEDLGNERGARRDTGVVRPLLYLKPVLLALTSQGRQRMRHLLGRSGPVLHKGRESIREESL